MIMKMSCVCVYTHTYTHTHTHKGILLSHKNENVIMPFAASLVDLKVIVLNKLS